MFYHDTIISSTGHRLAIIIKFYLCVFSLIQKRNVVMNIYLPCFHAICNFLKLFSSFVSPSFLPKREYRLYKESVICLALSFYSLGALPPHTTRLPSIKWEGLIRDKIFFVAAASLKVSVVDNWIIRHWNWFNLKTVFIHIICIAFCLFLIVSGFLQTIVVHSVPSKQVKLVSLFIVLFPSRISASSFITYAHKLCRIMFR